MNLHAHGTTSSDLSIASLRKTTHKQAMDNSIIAWRSLSVARQNLPRPPGGTPLLPGTKSLRTLCWKSIV